MRKLDDAFKDAFKKITDPTSTFFRILDAKLSKINIVLSKNQKRKITKQLETGSISLTITDSQIKKSRHDEKYIEEYIKDIFNDFSESVNEYETIFRDITEKMTEDISDDYSEKIFQQLLRTFKKTKRNREKIHKKFQDDSYRYWRESFNYMDMILYITREIIETIEVKTDDITPNRNLLLIKLMSKGCLLFSEIITLLKNGFSDGAYSRWRSLHEVTVLAEFLSDKSEDIAQKFIDHQIVQDYKHAKYILDSSSTLYQFEISENDFQNIRTNYDNVIEKYGRIFSNDYGWAYDLFDKKRIYFSDIEKSVNFESIRSHYRMSSDSIHTNSRGLFYNMGLIENLNTDLLIGPSIIGLSIPISLAVTSITLLNMNVLFNINNEVIMDELVFLKIFNKFKESIIPNCFDEENILIDKVL